PLPTGSGEGRVGMLTARVSLRELAQTSKRELKATGIQVVGDPNRPIRRVAIACGAAGEYLTDAVRAKADVFVTGEMRFHDLLRAEAEGIALLLPGHYATERPGIEELAVRLQNEFSAVTVW